MQASENDPKGQANDGIAAFIEAACVPLDGQWHGSGTLDRANAFLAADPEIADASIYTAAILGNADAVRRSLNDDPRLATENGGSRNWDALTYCCFSRFMRLDKSRSDGFVRTVQVLLGHSADANGGFYWDEHQPGPTWESVLYGATVANHVGSAGLLLEAGADPNDREVAYHAPEHGDSEIMKLVVECGRVNEWSLTTMLLRKIDFHDDVGVRWLLEQGASPNDVSSWGKTALHQVVLRRNPLEMAELLMDHGADPTIETANGKSAVALAARVGRIDLLKLFIRHGSSIELEGADPLLAACARADEATARAILASDPDLIANLNPEDKSVFAEVAGSGNTAAVRLMLGLGFDVAHPSDSGNTPLHLSIWRGAHDTSRLLIERGASLEQTNDAGVHPCSTPCGPRSREIGMRPARLRRSLPC